MIAGVRYLLATDRDILLRRALRSTTTTNSGSSRNWTRI